LVTVKLNEVVPFSGMVAAPNVFVIPGGEITLRFAVAVFPFPPFAEVTAAVVLAMPPADVPFTLTLNVHEPFAVMLAPDKLTVLAPALAPIAPPPQAPVRPFGVATTKPAGKASVNPTLVSARVFAAGFVMVKLKAVVPFSGIVAVANDLLIEGGSSTVMLADAVPPAPPSTEVTTPVVLFCAPAAVPMTFTLNVHDALMFSVAPVRLTLLPPALAAIVPPPHDPVRPFGVATAMPPGNVSVKPTPVSAIAFAAGFAMVKLRLVLPFRATVGAPNVLVMVGGSATVTAAVLLIAPAPVSVEEIAPVVLDLIPTLIPVTFTENVQKLFAAKLAPARLILLEPGAAVIAPPPQLPVIPLGDATCSPAGSVSLNPIPLNGSVEFGLLTVNVSEVVPFSGIAAEPNV
jgi:hypothetical protein